MKKIIALIHLILRKKKRKLKGVKLNVLFIFIKNLKKEKKNIDLMGAKKMTKILIIKSLVQELLIMKKIPKSLKSKKLK